MEPTDTTAIERPENFANLVMGRIHLLIPQSDIETLEPATDLVPSVDHPGSIGQFARGDKVWPIYALSAELAPLPDRPEEYRIAVLMKHGERPYGVLCKQLDVIEHSRLAMHPVPPVMSNRQSPLLALALYEGEVRCVSSARALERLVREQTTG